MTTTESMIKALRAYASEHKHDIVSTDAVDVSEMCFDVADRLEELVKGKHGHWIFAEDMVSYIKCSECGDNICWVNTKRPKYCHGCGARMDGEQND